MRRQLAQPSPEMTRVLDRGYGRVLGNQQRLAARGHLSTISFGDVLFAGLAVTAWATTTALTTAGLFVALFLAAGNGTLSGFFEQVALLATRYGEVEPIYRVSFDRQLMIVIATVFTITGFFRGASLISIFKTGGVDGPQSNTRA